MNRFADSGRLVALAVLSCLCACSLAQITKTSHGYTFRAKFVKGERRAYRMTSVIGAPGVNWATTAPFTMLVLSVHKGVAHIRYTAGPVYVGNQATGKKDTVEVDMNARNQSVQGAGPIPQFGQVTFPGKPVKVGEGWTRTVDASAGSMPIHVDSQFKLAGFRQLGARHVAWITVKIKNSKSYPTTGSGIIALDVRDASLVKMQMNMVMSLGSGAQKNPDVHAKKFRVKVAIARKEK
jgi:hypothetical protein